jgi:hypothetical protein
MQLTFPLCSITLYSIEIKIENLRHLDSNTIWEENRVSAA